MPKKNQTQHMSIAKRKSHKKAVFISCGIGVIFILSGVYLWYTDALSSQGDSATNNVNSQAADATVDNTAEPDSEVTSKDETPQSNKEKFSSSAQNDEPNDVTQIPSNEQTVTLSSERRGSKVVVFTKLENINAGKCSISIKNGSLSYTDTADIIYQPEYSTCAGFNIPISRLHTGSWYIELLVENKLFSKTYNSSIEVE